MRKLREEKMIEIEGGCDGVIASGVLAIGGMGVALVFLGPVGWAGALIAGVGGTVMASMCE